ncbi:MAG: NADH-quinone oxidoreductase subunit H [Candidatus Omnitrophica bacterium]|nr:NADH-quinone oxidoreductase subunit H [Candidatus Omnitrophota bacterium]
MNALNVLFSYIIFPGFLFSSIAGLLASWVDRKVSARLQWRKGPPWYQNFVDIVKLWGKEVIVPEGAKATFLIAPYIGLLSVVFVSTILGLVMLSGQQSFAGDLIVVVYLLIVPALAVIIGACASGNPLASVGASREMKLVLSYELPFILVVIAIILKAKGALGLESIIGHQQLLSSHIYSTTGLWGFSYSGILGFFVAIVCMQAKLGLAPFDIAEAEQEIMGGVLIEYSGLPLALFKLTKSILLYAMPLFLIVLFLGKDISPLFLVLKYVGLLVVIILIKNTNPRLKIHQAMKFFWGPVSVAAVAAVVLALFGL